MGEGDGEVEAWLDGVPSSVVTARPGQQLTIGRGADLDLDTSNRAMHRQACRLVAHGERWFVENTSAGPITVGGLVLRPRDDVSLAPGRTELTIEAGGVRYLVCVRVGGPGEGPGTAGSPSWGTTTERPSPPVLRDGERRVLAALCEPSLRRTSVGLVVPVPSDAEIAQRLVMAPRSVSEYVGRILTAFRTAGYHGLRVPQDTGGQLAPGHRHGGLRRLLVDTAIEARIVTTADLADLLPDACGDVPG